MEFIHISEIDKNRRLNELGNQIKAQRDNLSKEEKIGFDPACSVISTWIQGQPKLLGQHSWQVGEELYSPHLR